MRDDKLFEVVQILKKNPEFTVDQVDEQILKNGMGLGIVDKIQLLRSKKDELNIQILQLAKAQKEFDEYGFGQDPRQHITQIQESVKEIDSRIEKLKEVYRKLFPKKEIFK